MIDVLVLGGGNSTERDVSLRSATAVVAALKTAGFSVETADPKDGEQILDNLNAETIVFPILHGAGGEDGVIQKMLEERNLPFLGSDSKSSRVCFDKGLTRAAFKRAGLPVAEGATVDRTSYKEHSLAKRPHVLKVSRGGSSIGTYLVYDPASIDQGKVDEVFKLDQEAVLEELIAGVEITVPILDNKALPAIEIRPPKDEEFDYLNKYNGKTEEICPPESIGSDLQTKAQKYAEQAHEALNCRHLSRIDFMVRPDGTMVLLEINTMPGMTNRSLYPKSAQVSGIGFPDLMKRFVGLVKRDNDIK